MKGNSLNINKEIAKIAFPSILANITVPLVGMVDTAVSGHLCDSSTGGAAALIGGIAIGSMLFDLLYWNFGFLRVSTGGLTAQSFGKWKKDGGHPSECADNLVRSLTIAIASAALLIAIPWVFVRFAFLFVRCTDEVRLLASQYFFIRIWAAPATLSLMAFKGWFIGMQDSVSAMTTDIVVNGVNILASIVLALGVGGWSGFGFRGVAYGTVVAQYSGLMCAVLLLIFKYRRTVLPCLRVSGVLKGEATSRFFSMNRDIFVRSLCFIAIYIGYTVISAEYGDVLLASCSILMKLLMIYSYFIDGFAYSGEAMAGKYIGKCDGRMFQLSIRFNFIWSAALSALFLFVYALAGVVLVRLMTTDTTVVSAASEYIFWLMLMPIVGCAAFMWDGIFIGATESKHLRDAMLFAVAAFFSVWFAGKAIIGAESSPQMHIHVLMAAYFAHLLARSVYLSLCGGKMVGNCLERMRQVAEKNVNPGL